MYNTPAVDSLQKTSSLVHHPSKVTGHKSPFDRDWTYWTQRIQCHPLKPSRVVKVLKWQGGKCEQCGLPFTTEDVIEVHPINGNHADNRYLNLSLRHGHCYDITQATRYG